mmetsp:Transcript_56675/g.133420  ORF Transcript_56675/g.133420 Transcript_56675/m.133420 type:complete len:204 (+) Transcript_56675:44-655(+)
MQQQGVHTVCFKQAIFNPPGSGSPISKDKGINSVCRDNAMVQAFGDLTTRSLGISRRRRDAKLRVTLIARKDYQGLGSMQRKIDNAEDIVEAVRRHMSGEVDIELVDYAQLAWLEQLQNDADTDILMGVHGAGMTQLMFLPPHAAVVEMFIPGTSGNRHYHNLGNWANKLYHELHVDVHVDTGGVVNLLQQIVPAVRNRKESS